MVRVLAAVLAVVVLGAVVGVGVRGGGAQDGGTPAVLATPDTALCATPLADAGGASPVTVELAPTTAASPGAIAEPGEEIGFFPCATPVSSPVASPAPTEAAVATTAAGAPAVSAGPIDEVMIDIAFQPAVITIPANTDVTINLLNQGVLVHNFVVDALGINSGDYQSQQAGSVTVNAPAGEYEYYCSVPGHKDIGMVGRLVVQ